MNMLTKKERIQALENAMRGEVIHLSDDHQYLLKNGFANIEHEGKFIHLSINEDGRKKYESLSGFKKIRNITHLPVKVQVSMVFAKYGARIKEVKDFSIIEEYLKPRLVISWETRKQIKQKLNIE